MTILVFGKTGQVATELGQQATVTALGRDDADLMDPDACANAIRAHSPTCVINAAAWTQVDKAEDSKTQAQQINGHSPGAIAQACAKRGIPFLHVSTDYVFDGSGQTPWRETDRPAPQNTYGRTKLSGEQAIQAAGGNWAILRTSWVFSAHGANFVKTMLKLSQSRDQLSIVTDQIGGPTPAGSIAATLLTMAQAMTNGQQGGLYHYAGQPSTSWADFARHIFALANRPTKVTDIPTSAYPTPAKRPLNSRLDCAKLEADFAITPPDWKAALAQVIKDIEGQK